YKLAEQRISTALDAALDASNWGTEKAKNKRATKQVKKGSNKGIIKAHLDQTVPMTRVRIPKLKEVDLTDEEKEQEQKSLAIVRQVKKDEKALHGRGKKKTELGELIDKAVRLRAKRTAWRTVFIRCIPKYLKMHAGKERVKREKALRSAVSIQLR